MQFDKLFEGVMNEGLGYYSSRQEQQFADKDKADFKRREQNAGLGNEVAQQQAEDRGPWYIKVNGVTLKSQGQPKVFNWKSGASKYASAILKNNPSLKGKVFLGKQPE